MAYNMEREGVFNEWCDFQESIEDHLESINVLRGIVQNPVNISEDQIKEWREVAFKNWVKFEKFSIEFKGLVAKTLNHLRSEKNNE